MFWVVVGTTSMGHNSQNLRLCFEDLFIHKPMPYDVYAPWETRRAVCQTLRDTLLFPPDETDDGGVCDEAAPRVEVDCSESEHYDRR